MSTRRKIYTSSTGNRVYFDSEFEEYSVVFVGRSYHDNTTYFTDCKQDAIDTANTQKLV